MPTTRPNRSNDSPVPSVPRRATPSLHAPRGKPRALVGPVPSRQTKRRAIGGRPMIAGTPRPGRSVTRRSDRYDQKPRKNQVPRSGSHVLEEHQRSGSVDGLFVLLVLLKTIKRLGGCNCQGTSTRLGKGSPSYGVGRLGGFTSVVMWQ